VRTVVKWGVAMVLAVVTLGAPASALANEVLLPVEAAGSAYQTWCVNNEFGNAPYESGNIPDLLQAFYTEEHHAQCSEEANGTPNPLQKKFLVQLEKIAEESAAGKLVLEGLKSEVKSLTGVVEGTLKVDCTTGCAGGGGGGEFTLSSATSKQVDTNTESVTDALWYLIGTLICCTAVMLFYLEIRHSG
jgi:hypothetical protein